MAFPSTDVASNQFTNGTLADADEVNANFNDLVNGASALGVPVEFGIVPIGSIVAWHKTAYEKTPGGDTNQNTTQSATQLIDSAADYVNDGITAGMIVHNEDDNEFAIVETVVDGNTLTLANDVNANTTNIDTFNGATGVNYAIYAVPELPDNWLECNGQTISDADSPINGMTLPNLHTAVEETHGRFLRGQVEGGATGQTEGSQIKAHIHNNQYGASGSRESMGAGSEFGWPPTNRNVDSTGGSESRPVSFTVCWIMRIK
ncbi:hypothetical protein CMI37_29285 [Candidatus Pacearchaeota archaeon]|nr:hypothetical protein [Candidatus Pacearchaeota archaeon]|tara:strand:- start:542 stop:1324 length:783 start_codon:yes stop_codon:yes gene_type:complete